MGDASFNKGGVAARNLKGGSVDVADGDSSVSYSFDRPMKSNPTVVATVEGTDKNVYVTAVDQNGFTVDLSSAASGSVKVNWMAFNDDRA